ncbi:MAG: hypothetical protein NTY53_18105 [Kiritimatiellaeota bacterium]|nr:hypothetical protein [Kiritimatiellota bacterium]
MNRHLISAALVTWVTLTAPLLAAEQQHDTPDLALTGHGWSLMRLADGERAFANRTYVWQGVPEKFRNWRITQTSGGVRAEIRVKAKRDTTLFACTTAQQTEIVLAGWNTVATAAFHYTDKSKAKLTVYCRPLKVGEELVVPQGNWAGVMVLLPPDGVSTAALVAGAQPLAPAREFAAGETTPGGPRPQRRVLLRRSAGRRMVAASAVAAGRTATHCSGVIGALASLD